MPVDVSDEVCEKCGKQMVVKMGRFGKFLACPGFPECKNTKPFLEEAGVKCPKCAGRVIYRKTKRGRKYLGCENYPKCDFMTWDMPSDKTCPKCSNFLTQKSKGNTITYKCSNTECDYLDEQLKEGKAAKTKK
jgi:DNA topoisomerase-1